MTNQEKSAAELYREERKKRIAKAAKKNAKGSMNEKVQTRIVIAVFALIAIGIIGAIAGGIVENSGILERNKTIMTIGGVDIDKYEYAYYYSNAMQESAYQSYYYDMYMGTGTGAMYTGYDYSKAPSEQSYAFGDIEGVENPTFSDYFSDVAIKRLQYVKASLAYAKENEIALDEADYKEIDYQFETIEANLLANAESGTKVSLAQYLRLYYGSGMTEKLFRRIAEENALATKVGEMKTEEFEASYDEDKLNETFKEEIETYGVVSMLNYVITAETVEQEAEEGEEATSAPTKETLAAAKTKAEAFAKAATDVDAFRKQASELEKENGNKDYKNFITDESLTLIENDSISNYTSDEDFKNWVSSTSTKKGSTYILESDTGYTVYYMVDPAHKSPDEDTYDVRHILVKFPEEDADAELATDGDAKKEEKKVEIKTLDLSKYDVTVDIDVNTEETKNPEYYNKALDILESYLKGDKTETDFAILAMDNSEDSNASTGGIYEGVTHGEMVTEFESWAIDPERKEGDVGIVETTYGYHVMYFIKTGVATWQDSVRADLASADKTEYDEELIAQDSVKPENIDAEMSADVDKFVDEMAEVVASQYQQQSMISY